MKNYISFSGRITSIRSNQPIPDPDWVFCFYDIDGQRVIEENPVKYDLGIKRLVLNNLKSRRYSNQRDIIGDILPNLGKLVESHKFVSPRVFNL